MAFVRAEAEAVNCGNDHKTRNEAEAATGLIRGSLILLPEIRPEPQWPPRYRRRRNPWKEVPIRKRSGLHRNGRDFVLRQSALPQKGLAYGDRRAEPGRQAALARRALPPVRASRFVPLISAPGSSGRRPEGAQE